MSRLENSSASTKMPEGFHFINRKAKQDFLVEEDRVQNEKAAEV